MKYFLQASEHLEDRSYAHISGFQSFQEGNKHRQWQGEHQHRRSHGYFVDAQIQFNRTRTIIAKLKSSLALGSKRCFSFGITSKVSKRLPRSLLFPSKQHKRSYDASSARLGLAPTSRYCRCWSSASPTFSPSYIISYQR